MDILRRLNKIGFIGATSLCLKLDFDKSKIYLRLQPNNTVHKRNPEYSKAEIEFEQVSSLTIWSPNGENSIRETREIQISSCVFWMENNVPKTKLNLVSVETKYNLVLIFSFKDATIELF